MEYGIGIALVLLVIFVGHDLSDLIKAKATEIGERARRLQIRNDILEKNEQEKGEGHRLDA